MNNLIKAIIFDFDFTLADPSIGTIDCINYALRNMGLPEKDSQQILATVGLSLKATFAVLSDNKYPDRSTEFQALFSKRADQVMVDGIVLFDDVRNVMQNFFERGYLLGIVSTKYRYRIEEFLRRENLLNLFSVIIGGEDVSLHKPDPTPLLMAIERLNLSNKDILYIGDSITDAQTAVNANTLFIAVLTGVTDKAAFLTYNPWMIIDNLKSLEIK